MGLLALLPWLTGAGAAAIPFLMRNPRIAQAIGGKLGKKVFTPPATIRGPMRPGEDRNIPAGGFIGNILIYPAQV